MLLGAWHGASAQALSDEVHRDQMLSLVNELKVSVLAVIAQTAPQNGPGCNARFCAVVVNLFTVGLHVHLLNEGREFGQGVVLWCDEVSGSLQKISVPNAKQSHQQGEVLLCRCAQEMLIHGVATG